jgi:hypothetical protein
MLKKILCMLLIVLILFPTVFIQAMPRDAELVLENVGIEPSYPKKGEMVAISGEVQNVGFRNTKFFASIITVAYFVDGKLLQIGELDNVEPGVENKIKISSDPVWKADLGKHEIKIILDYHNTLKDQYDSPSNNFADKILFITSPKKTQILLDISPQYIIQEKEMPKITASLIDSDSNKPLSNQKIVFNLDSNEFNLITNKNGNISFSNKINSFNTFNVTAYFEGNQEYSSTSISSTVYVLPKNTTSAMIIKISDTQNQYNFEKYMFDIIIFQDSYKKMIKKIQPDATNLLDSKTFWTTLPSGHNYFAEIYMNGKLLFVTKNDLLDDITIKNLKMPEVATIRFKITESKNQPIANVLVNNWIYSATTNENGVTDWIDVLPTFTDNVPYTAKATLPDGKVVWSEPFWLFSGERKIIDINTHGNVSESEIPSWIKNNAGWWADGSIDDSSFVQGIQYLIKEGILKIPPTTQGEGSGSNEIPSWIKNNAGWWADGSIDDSSFVQGIQYLIKEGILRIVKQ